MENKDLVKNIEDEKKNACTLDLLLSSDLKNFKTVSRDVEIERLSKSLGTPFVVTLKPLTIHHEEDIIESCNKIEYDNEMNPSIDIKSHKQKCLILIDAIYLNNEQIFKKSELMRKFNAQNPQLLIEKMLSRGEISKLYDQYKEMCGFNKTSVKEIKN